MRNKEKIKARLVNFYLYTGLSFFILYSIGEFFAYPETYTRRIANTIFLVSYLTVLNYIFFEKVIRLFQWPCKNNQRAFILFFITIFFYTFGLYSWRYLWIHLHIYVDYTPNLSLIRGIITHTQFSLACFLFFAVVRNVYNNIRLREKNNQLRIEKKEAELNYLKAQTNPHFLFNTLNNIYSLARDKSDLAPESIMQLSKILRFMLYETSDNFIPIDHELKIIKDYISLEKLRYDDSLTINMNIDIEDASQDLPPLLLIPLVENAFKHGASETTNKPFVDINLHIKDHKLLFVVKNSTEENPLKQVVTENIGLTNLRRQLSLLYNDYNLFVDYKDAVFTSVLKINLTSNV